MQRNAKLFSTLAKIFEIDPELHDQNVWENECGTKACIAGWACIIGTDDFKFTKKERWVPKRKTLKAVGYTDSQIDDMDDDTRIDFLANRHESYFISTARELLGLERHESDALFAGETGPIDGYELHEAMQALADGLNIGDVWGHDIDIEDDEGGY